MHLLSSTINENMFPGETVWTIKCVDLDKLQDGDSVRFHEGEQTLLHLEFQCTAAFSPVPARITVDVRGCSSAGEVARRFVASIRAPLTAWVHPVSIDHACVRYMSSSVAIISIAKWSCGHRRIDTDRSCPVCLTFPGRARVTT